MTTNTYRTQSVSGIEVAVGKAGFWWRLRLAIIALVEDALIFAGILAILVMGSCVGMLVYVVTALDPTAGLLAGSVTSAIVVLGYVGLVVTRTMSRTDASRLLPRAIRFEVDHIFVQPRNASEAAYRTSWNYIVTAEGGASSIDLSLSGTPRRTIRVSKSALGDARFSQLTTWLKRHDKFKRPPVADGLSA